MMKEKVGKGGNQRFLDRNRAPRVEITYDVEIAGAIERRELPFEVGIFADLSGNAGERKTALKDRNFCDIDFDNFDEVLKAICPRLAFEVDAESGSENRNMTVELCFERIADFEPANVVLQVGPLRTLFEARQQISKLAIYMDGRIAAEELIANLLQDRTLVERLAAQKAENGGLMLQEGKVPALLEKALHAKNDPANQSVTHADRALAVNIR